jgi:hypothetical protein
VLSHAGREWGAVKKNEKKKKNGKEKKRERERRKEETNRLSNFLEIMIDNLYLLCYY